MQLLYRTTRQVALTDVGRALFQRCQDAARQRDEALALVGETEEPHGELRITCATAFGSRYVAPIMAGFLLDNPRVAVTLDLSNRVHDLVAEGYDLAIRTGVLSDSSLTATRISSRRLCLCGAPAYLARAGRPVALDELARHDCLLGTASTWRFEVDGSERSFRPEGRWRCNNGDAVFEAAVAGLGLCQLPDFQVLEAIRDGRLEMLLADFAPRDQLIWAVCPQQRHPLPTVRAFIATLRAKLDPALGRAVGDV